MSVIRLRKLKERDARGMLEWMTDPCINKFFRFDASNLSEESCLCFINNSANQKDNIHMAIVNDEDEYLGTVSLKDIDRNKKRAEYAIATRSKAHGKGIALIATNYILKMAFDDLMLDEVYLNVLTDNLRANAFYIKAGFSFDRCEKNAFEIRGEAKDLNWYSVTRNSFFRMMDNADVLI